MSSRLSAEECRRAMEGLAPQIERYAELLVHRGAAIKPGQELVLQAPVERADFVRIVVGTAYRAGTGHVTVIWRDDVVQKLTFESVVLDFFKHTDPRHHRLPPAARPRHRDHHRPDRPAQDPAAASK